MKKIPPITAEQIRTFAVFSEDRIGLTNTADILHMLFGLTDDEVRGIIDKRLFLIPSDDGGFIINTDRIINSIGTHDIYFYKKEVFNEEEHKLLEWGYISPNGDVYGGISYNTYDMLHEKLADIICDDKSIETYGHTSYSILESLGYIKFTNSYITASDFSILTGKSTLSFITETQKEVVANYMEHSYRDKHTMPSLGYIPHEYPITYIRVRMMSLENFREYITDKR